MRAVRSIAANCVLLLSLAVAPQPAAADIPSDEVTTRDGSVLKGKISRVEDDELILDTDYSNDVAIDVAHIVDLESERRFSVRLVSGEIISGFLEVSDGRIVLRESLLTPAEPGAEQAPETVGLEAIAGEVLPATPAPGVDRIAVQAAPSAGEAPPPDVIDERPRDEGKLEIAATPKPDPAAPATAIEPPVVRSFTFDDVDWIRKKPAYLRYAAEFNTGAQAARGNSDTTDLHFDALFEPSFGWNTVRISGVYDKKKAGESTTANRWRAEAAYERDFLRRWFVGVANTYESDRQKDLDLRFIVSGGVGYRFFDEAPTFLSVLPALAYVNENFEEFVDPVTNVKLPSEDSQYVAFQFQTDFETDLYDDVSFFHNHTYLSNLQDLGDILVETRTGIGFDMPWNLVLAAEFQSDWENEPAQDAKQLDTRYMLTVGFELRGDENDWFQ